MSHGSPGYLSFDEKMYRFDDATWDLDGGELFLDASCSKCEISLVGIPFQGAKNPEDLPGKIWAPSEEDFSPGDDIFAEGGLTIRGERYEVMSIRVECRSYNRESGILKVAIRMTVENEDYGDSGEAEVFLACEAT